MNKELSYRTDPWFPHSVGAPRHLDNVSPVNSLSAAAAAGIWRLGDLAVNRLGFGAMRLTGSLPFAEGSPSDRGQSIAVLRRAVELGVNHIDTAAWPAATARPRPSSGWPGPSTSPHLEENVGTAALRLSPEDLSLLDAAV